MRRVVGARIRPPTPAEVIRKRLAASTVRIGAHTARGSVLRLAPVHGFENALDQVERRAIDAWSFLLTRPGDVEH